MNDSYKNHPAPTQSTPDKYRGPVPTKEGAALVQERLLAVQRAAQILKHTIEFKYPPAPSAKPEVTDNYATENYDAQTATANASTYAEAPRAGVFAVVGTGVQRA